MKFEHEKLILSYQIWIHKSGSTSDRLKFDTTISKVVLCTK